MPYSDEWWEEAEANPELYEFFEALCSETIDSIDPPPGLRIFLERNGLGIIPIHKDRYIQDAVVPLQTGEKLKFKTPFVGEIPPVASIGDKIEYKSAPDGRGTIRAGRGFITRIYNDHTYLIDDHILLDISKDTMTVIKHE